MHKARELKAAGTPIALLTNNVAEWGDNWRSTIPVEELFEIVVDSSAVRLRKPDPAIYLLTCERIGVAPEAAVFLDDNHDNIAAARALGMETVTRRTRTRSSPWPSSRRSSNAARPPASERARSSRACEFAPEAGG